MNASNEVALMAMLVALIAAPRKTLLGPSRPLGPRQDGDGERQQTAATPFQLTSTG